MGDRMQPFVKECHAASESHAVEYIYSEFGSKHKTPRNKIKIEEINEKE
jgi:large subunit ribosomal protein LX